MSTLQDFDTALNEVVQAKRLSQSKMTKLTEVAMKLMDQDTQLVSTMYRTHKSLSASSKISSLYVFDALARAARQQVLKHNLSERHTTGNCATFLLKVAGVLEGLFQDMLATGRPEAKEKTKKIYDIWVKGCTFPPIILSRLSDIVSGKDKEPEVTSPVPVDPRPSPQTNPTASVPSPTIPAPTDSQSTLLALLAQAASQQAPQTTVNTAISPTASVEPAHLAILQYLQSASVNNTTTSQISPITSTSVSDTHVSQTATDPRISRSPLVPHAELSHARQSERHDSYRSPPRNDRYHEKDYDDRAYSRNDHRGNFRRRGRWNRWDERERDHYRDTNEMERGPRGGGRSRSRSPDGRSRRRSSPPPTYSPARRQSLPSRPQYGNGSASGPTEGRSGKDEFGRDLRSPSPSKSPSSGPISNLSANPSPITPSTPHDPKAEFSSTCTSNDPMSRSSSIAANTSSKDPNTSIPSFESSTKTTSQTGMEDFNMSTFDPTSPASWEALGKMWEAMHGYTPSTEELMQFVIMGAVSQSDSKNWHQDTVEPNGTSGHGGGHGKGSFPRGRGGYGGFYGNTRESQHGWTNHDEAIEQSTDAVVLGGGETDVDTPGTACDVEQQPAGSGGRTGGKMQKVGDRWVFTQR